MTEPAPSSVPEPVLSSAPESAPSHNPSPDERLENVASDPQQLHPLSPLVSALPVIPALFLMSFFFNGGFLWDRDAAGVPVAAPTIFLIFLVMAGFKYVQWRRYTYWFDGSGDLRIDDGVLNRNERKVQLSRLQAVDVEQPILARLVGLAVVRIDVAGGADSKVAMAYLTLAQAEEMRAELLARSAGVHGHDEGAIATPEELIATVETNDLVVSLLLRTVTFGLFVLTAVVIFFIFTTEGAGGLLLLPVTGGIPLLMVVSEFMALYGFTVARAKDGVRLRRGLLQKTAQTVPHGRVAAVDIVEPLLWRSRGWVRIRLTVAGVASSGDGGDQASLASTTLIPVATHELAEEVLAQVLPGVNVADIELTAAPKRAKWRAPIQHSQLAYGSNELVFVTRRGFFTRHLSIVPHARTQSVSLQQGPFQRKLGLSSLRVDVAPGPVLVEALYFPVEQMRALADQQADRARLARATDWAHAPVSPTPPGDHSLD
ncbi:MAG: PH domain-containing protein [Actinobacteria bacterium]|nr:PH domain-containing protein [Actinomycetota bacterium]